jgi:hypothetical protein
VTVLVARDRGGSAAGVCFYLVDTWCLGLKDAAGPRPVDRRRLGGFIQQIFGAWDEPAVQVPLDLGRQMVYGAIGYARELGVEPHPDFGRTAGYLVARDVALDLQPPDPGPSVYLLLDLGSISHPALIFPASPDSSAWSARRFPAAGYW